MAIMTTTETRRYEISDRIKEMMFRVLLSQRENAIPNARYASGRLSDALVGEVISAPPSFVNDKYPYNIAQLNKSINTWPFRYTRPDMTITPIMFYNNQYPPPVRVALHRCPVATGSVPGIVFENPLVITRNNATATTDAFVKALEAQQEQEKAISDAYDTITLQVLCTMHHLPTVNAAVEAFPEIEAFFPTFWRSVLDKKEKTADGMADAGKPDKELFIKTAAAYQMQRLDK